MPEERAVRIKFGTALGPEGLRAVGTLKRVTKELGSAARKALNFGKYIGAAGLGILTKAVMDAREFNLAMAEVATIMRLSADEMKGVNEQLLTLSKETGKAPVELTRGLYQTVSAGVEAGKAMEFLEQATRAAIGGVAEVKEAVDLSTSVLDAYGMATEEVGRIHDIAFKTIEKGKTTYSELAASMGTVLPFASQLDISLEDLFAATAALTKGGIETATATTYLKGVLSAVISPSAKAAETAEDLEIGFNAAALKAKGLAGFLDDVKTATKGDIEVLGKLFGNVRGLGAVLALTGKQAEEFAKIQDALRDSTGAAGEAFTTMAESDAKKFDDALNNIRVTMIIIGSTVLPAVADALGDVAAQLEEWDKDGVFLLWWERAKLVVDGFNVGLAGAEHALNSLIDLYASYQDEIKAVIKYTSPAGYFAADLLPEVNAREARRRFAESGQNVLAKTGEAEEQAWRTSQAEETTRARQRGEQQGREWGDVVRQEVDAGLDGFKTGMTEATNRDTQGKVGRLRPAG